jgi:hypothetical protein
MFRCVHSLSLFMCAFLIYLSFTFLRFCFLPRHVAVAAAYL